MFDDTGAIRQESLRANPAMEQMQSFAFPLRGSITAVYYMDNGKNKTGQTLVDVELLGGYSKLLGVPLAVPKVNSQNGEEWTPDPGDIVIVQFINGRFVDPVVTGWTHLPSNKIQATTADAPVGKRRYHLRCNKTDIVIDKDGNRITTVEKNETLHIKVDQSDTIDGKRTTIIEGNESLTVNSGDITVDVVAGKCTVHVKGKTAWTSEGTIDLDGKGGGAVKGVVQGDCICPFIKKPHLQISATVKASK